MDPEARRQFQELLSRSSSRCCSRTCKGMQQAHAEHDARRTCSACARCCATSTSMLREKMQGGEPDFQAFKDKWGQSFPGVESLDELMEQMRQQMAADAVADGQHVARSSAASSQEMMESLLKDEQLQMEMAQLAMNLDELMPMDDLRRRYRFRGDDQLSLEEAMQLMDEMQQLDQLERQLRRAREPERPGRHRRRAGRAAPRRAGAPNSSSASRSSPGSSRRPATWSSRATSCALTARAIRKIGDKALRDIFAHLKRDRFGRHAVDHRGAGGDRTDESKPYEFGDPFLLDLRETLMNSVERQRRGRAGAAASRTTSRSTAPSC